MALLEEAGIGEPLVLEDVRAATSAWRRIPRSEVAYVLDLNAVTVPAVLALTALHRPFVIDFGDDSYSLAVGRGLGRRRAAVRWTNESYVLNRALAVVHRGRLHPVLRHLGSRTLWCPDTVADTVLQERYADGDPGAVATFGSMGLPAPGHPPWTYGTEVIEAVICDSDLTGIVVGDGPGLEVARRYAEEAGVAGRVRFHGRLPMEQLLDVVCEARWATSWQSNDKAGWVRTTGKLPLLLGAGRAVLATDVGEAAMVLPQRWLVEADRKRAGELVSSRIRKGAQPEDYELARTIAERYRRSRVAADLVHFLGCL